jgi:hypothetical protein
MENYPDQAEMMLYEPADGSRSCSTVSCKLQIVYHVEVDWCRFST